GAPDANWWMDQAIKYTTPLEPRKFDRDVHDLGFIFLSTYYRWHQLTKLPELNEVLVQSGQTLALRFREKGQYLSSFVAENSLFIDIMMNVGLIFYAARETGDRLLRDVAMRHALTTRRVLVRGDGSTSHEGIFSLETGEFLRQTTQQGYRGDSCWSRGLAWSLYGFGTCYQLTQEPIYLKVALLNADYWFTNVSRNGVAPWDFDAPGEGPLSRTQVDTSASAIAAVGLFNLAELSSESARRQAYLDCALRTVDALITDYLGEGADGWEGILRGGVYHIHKGLAVNES